MKNKQLTRMAAFLLIIALVLAGCGNTTPTPSEPSQQTAEDMAALKAERQAAMTAEQQEYYEKYIANHQAGGLFAININTGGFQEEVTFGDTTIYDIIGSHNFLELEEVSGGKIPAEAAEKIAEDLFDITVEDFRIIAGEAYNSAENVYLADKTVKAQTYYGVVTDVEKGDWTTLYVNSYREDSGKLAFTYACTIELQPNGSFQYIINSPVKMGEDETQLLYIDRGVVEIFIYNPTESVYEVKEVPTVDVKTYGDFIKLIAKECGIADLEIESFTLTKTYGVLNFSADYLKEALKTKEAEQMFFNSLATTLQRFTYVNPLVILADGTAYKSANITTVDGGIFIPAQYTMGNFSKEDYTQMRLQVPYESVEASDIFPEDDLSSFVVELDETTKPIAFFLYKLGIPEKGVTDPKNFSNAFKLQLAVRAAKPVMLYDGYEESTYSIYNKAVMPIAIAVSDDMFTLKEHVELAVKEVLGDDVTVQHMDADPRWTWHEEEGVYTPPHMDVGGYEVPVILEVKQNGEEIVATVAYYINGYSYLDENYNEIPGEQLESYMKEKAPRREITLTKTEDGSFAIKSIKELA